MIYTITGWIAAIDLQRLCPQASNFTELPQRDPIGTPMSVRRPCFPGGKSCYNDRRWPSKALGLPRSSHSWDIPNQLGQATREPF